MIDSTFIGDDEAAWGTRAADMRQKLAVNADDLIARVTFCVALECDDAVRQRLRRVAGIGEDEPLLVRPPASSAWFMLCTGRPPQVLRDEPKGVTRVVIDEVVGRDEDLRRHLMEASQQSLVHGEARDLLTAIFDANQSPSGEEITRLVKWAPILEHVAYRYFTYASMLVDQLRRSILPVTDKPSSSRDIELLTYWNCLHTMGHLLTIASTSGARPWLSQMAASFEWMTWTPSFVLLRERTLWLTAAAVKAAVAAGESMIGRYLAKLSRSDHPMKSFDALVGLVAIGLDQPHLAGSFGSELEALKKSVFDRDPAGASYVQPMFDTAMATLREPDVSERQIAELDREAGRPRPNGVSKLLNLNALRRDPTEFLPSGDVLGLLALPMIVRSDPADYYPQRLSNGRGCMIPPDDIREVLTRAWGPAGKNKRRTIH